MPLEKNDWLWLSSFSGGAIAVPEAQAPAAGSPEEVQLRLTALQNKEASEDQARKQVMIAAATARLEAKREEMRDAFQIKVEVYAKKDGAEQDAERKAEGKSANAKTKTLDTRAADGDQRKALDTKHHAGRIKSVEEDKRVASGKMMELIVKETDALAKATRKRSRLNDKDEIETEVVELFSAKEISDEIYAPMVREKIIGENFVPNKYSGTQRMLDGSNEHYINECKEKGKRIGFNKGEIAKGSIALAASTTSTVLSALAPVEEGQHAIANSGKLSKEMASRADEITKGIAALLTAGVDAGQEIDEYRNSSSYSDVGFKKVANGIGLGIGRIVAGALGNNNIGLAVTDGISSAVAVVGIGPRIAKWLNSSEPFPWGALVDDMGGAIESGLNVGGDIGNAKTSEQLGVAAPMIAGGFKVLAKAAESKAIKAIREGDVKTVLGILGTAGAEAANRIPAGLVYSKDYNEQEEFADQIDSADKAKTRTDFVNEAAGNLGEAAPGLADKGAGFPGVRRARGLADAGLERATTKRGERNAELDALFDKKKKEQDAAAEAAELADFNERQQKELKDYQTSLDCLGSKNPSDAEFKSIAKLIQQIETDRAIWTAIITISSGGIAVAQAFVPGLKAAGELVKYVANIKAAADRLKALLDWKEAQKDARSAVSPYASSIENMIRNQAEQLSHYSLQAAANAIKAIVAVGELSPYAPAFKVAGAAVGLAASTEELIYKAVKQAMLVASWSKTQKALHNPDDRILGLQAREMNPTLAKYTLAYGALIEHDQVAITACGRIGLDRETLARTGDKVSEVKDFMQTLYKDDNVVIGKLDAVKGKTKVPPAALTVKAWSVSHLLWTEKNGLTGANPPAIVAALTRIGKLEAKNRKLDYSELSEAELDIYLTTVTDLALAFNDYRPLDQTGSVLNEVGGALVLYAEMTAARQETIKEAIGLRQAGTPLTALVSA